MYYTTLEIEKTDKHIYASTAHAGNIYRTYICASIVHGNFTFYMRPKSTPKALPRRIYASIGLKGLKNTLSLIHAL